MVTYDVFILQQVCHSNLTNFSFLNNIENLANTFPANHFEKKKSLRLAVDSTVQSRYVGVQSLQISFRQHLNYPPTFANHGSFLIIYISFIK